MKKKKPLRYRREVSERFYQDIEFIRQNFVDPDDWGLFSSQFNDALDDLNRDWENLSRPCKYGKLSTYDYKKRYLHSIPLSDKQKRGWDDLTSDFRIVFKIKEEENRIFFYRIGKRIKGLPKDPRDIWSLIKGDILPEELQ